MIQKDSAVFAREVADKAFRKVNEQIAIIGKKDFDGLKKLTEPITDAGGYRVDYFKTNGYHCYHSY